jgi:hypothetical protein
MVLPSRKKHSKKPGSLPKDFLLTVAKLFQDQFKKELSGASFLAYGDLYPDEVVLCISLSHPKQLQSASMHVSTDLPKSVAENPEKVTEKLQVMVDVAASWFAQCFQAGKGLETVLHELREMDPAWQEFEWEKETLFVKLNKANYTLEKAATDFLKKAGFEEDADDMLGDLEDDLDDGDDEEGGGSRQLH